MAKVSFDSTQRIGDLSIGSGGVATVTAGGVNVLSVTSIGAGKLNLNDNQLIVDYASLSPSPIGSIRSLLTSGFHNGAWDGSGIMSSLANSSTFALGFAEASDVAVGGMFAGQSVDGTAVVVKFTLYGDATLDGSVDFNDLVKLAQHFNTALPARSLSLRAPAPQPAMAAVQTAHPAVGPIVRPRVREHDQHRRR